MKPDFEIPQAFFKTNSRWHKKDCGISKSGFVLKDQSVTLNYEVSYNERTLMQCACNF